ncbi:hypothetical protein [Candidatus Solincola tengchongensis]|uniref:hypothetical protein n=1 Tax=Candidatus Solincola tengchongensis TaxID=2900693 RepID=UPI0025811AF2|nr:hypothetical protein [Candidatus Solincola tengchongensis]
MEERFPERHCPLCNALLEEMPEEGCFRCRKCLSLSRFSGEELLAMDIPGYYPRLEELRRRNLEIITLIEAEGMKGDWRDMRSIRSLHEERQRVLSEYNFLSYFQQFVDRW